MLHTYDRVVYLNDLAQSQIDTLYAQGELNLDSSELAGPLHPHEKVIVTNALNPSQSALCLVKPGAQTIRLVKDVKPWGVTARNKEQKFLLDQLQDNSIRFQMILGKAGTGKTIMAYASALHQAFEKGHYKSIVLTKPTYEVGGGGGLGPVPGDINEKFSPFLINFEHIATELNASKFYQVQHAIKFLPIQRMRGASFIDTLVIADEVQSLDTHEMRTLCTRIGNNSKLIIMGDMNQIDRKIKVDQTGLYKLATSQRIKDSPLCATTQLTKNERSDISSLLDDVLGNE